MIRRCKKCFNESIRDYCDKEVDCNRFNIYRIKHWMPKKRIDFELKATK